MKLWFARKVIDPTKAPMPEYSPPSTRTSLVMSVLAFMATIARITLKIAALSILFVVTFITAIIWRR